MKGYIAAATLAVGIALCPQVANAQAWAGDKGVLSLSLSESYQFSDGVYYGSAGLITGLGVQVLRTTLDAEFTPIEKLTVGLDMTYQFNKYSGAQTGANPSIILGHGPNDDGDFHGELTDANLSARYQLLDGVIALSPVLRAKIPMTDYTNIGYAAAGTGLWEVGGGLAIGKAGLGLPNLFAEASYTYMIVQKEGAGGAETRAYSTNYSQMAGSVGYIIADKWVVAGGALFRITHGGVDVEDFRMLPQAVIDFHDPILRRRLFAVNLSGFYQATESIGLGLAFAAVLSGNNVNDAKVLNLNVTWTNDLLGGGSGNEAPAEEPSAEEAI